MESTQTSTNEHRRCTHRARGGLGAIVITAIVAGLAGGYLGKSFAQGRSAFADRGSITAAGPELARERAERLVKHFAAEVDATPEQQARLRVIASDAAAELAPMRASLRTARSQALALLGAAELDLAALEQLRVNQLRLADEASRRATRAIAEVAEVLTPEQRQKAAQRLEQRSARFERIHRGRSL